MNRLELQISVVGASAKGRALSIATLRAEAGKCMLLCHNCDARVDGGIARVSLH